MLVFFGKDITSKLDNLF